MNIPFSKEIRRTPDQNRALLDSERRTAANLTLRENIGNIVKFNSEEFLRRSLNSQNKMKGMKKYNRFYVREAIRLNSDRKKILTTVSKLHELESL